MLRSVISARQLFKSLYEGNKAYLCTRYRYFPGYHQSIGKASNFVAFTSFVCLKIILLSLLLSFSLFFFRNQRTTTRVVSRRQRSRNFVEIYAQYRTRILLEAINSLEAIILSVTAEYELH